MGLAVKLAQSVSYACCIAPTGDSPPFLVQVGLRASSTLGARVALFADTSPALLPRQGPRKMEPGTGGNVQTALVDVGALYLRFLAG